MFGDKVLLAKDVQSQTLVFLLTEIRVEWLTSLWWTRTCRRVTLFSRSN